MAQATLITGVERRRFFSREQKLALMDEAFGVGGSVSRVCRREDICSSLLYRWRQSALAKASRSPVEFQQAILSGPSPELRSEKPALIIELPSGARLMVDASASPSLLAATLKALR